MIQLYLVKLKLTEEVLYMSYQSYINESFIYVTMLNQLCWVTEKKFDILFLLHYKNLIKRQKLSLYDQNRTHTETNKD